MSLLLTHQPDDASAPWIEDHLQMELAKALRRLEDLRGDFTFAADMNGLAAASKREAGRAKLMGMRRGEADIRVYFPGGRMVMIELKLHGNTTSDHQDERHALFRRLGFDVHVLTARTPAQARDEGLALLGLA